MEESDSRMPASSSTMRMWGLGGMRSESEKYQVQVYQGNADCGRGAKFEVRQPGCRTSMKGGGYKVRSEGVEARTSAEGSSRMKQEPTGELSSTRRPPPCSATMRAAMARPRPVPRSLVEKWGRKSLSLSCGDMPWPGSATTISTKSES